jgi:hypothetical protein
MDFSSIIEQATKLAKVASAFVPGVAAGVEIGEKAIDLIDTISAKAPAGTSQDELRAARRELRAAVSAKAQATANRLEG